MSGLLWLFSQFLRRLIYSFVVVVARVSFSGERWNREYGEDFLLQHPPEEIMNPVARARECVQCKTPDKRERDGTKNPSHTHMAH